MGIPSEREGGPAEREGGPAEREGGPVGREGGPAAYVRSEVLCRRCGYDLRGLGADGRCPECGLEIWVTLTHVVDPMATRLPRLRDPLGVGNALLWLAFCMWAATLLLLAQAALVWMASVLPPRLGLWVVDVPDDLSLVAAVVVIAALWSALKFAPPRGKEPSVTVRMDVWVLGLSLSGLGLLMILLWHRERMWAPPFGARPGDVVAARASIHLAMAIVGAGVWFGLRGILWTIGQRSMLYRRAGRGRQNILPLIAAAMGIALGSGMRILGEQSGWLGGWAGGISTIGTIIAAACLVMLAIGQTYLLVNAWWVRQSLRHPPPKLEELLAPPRGR
jgi:hypothetical protein